MRAASTLVTTLLVLSILLVALPADAEVDWTDEVTDEQGDVRSTITGSVVPGQGHIDILTVSISEQADDVNVTLSLEAGWNVNAMYQVEAIADGDNGAFYVFTYSFTVWTITGHDVVEDQPETHVSSDGTRLSWVLAKSKVSATTNLTVQEATTTLIEGITTYHDSAGPGAGGNGGNGGGGDDGPDHIVVTVEMEPPTIVRTTVEIHMEDEDARDLREDFDLDLDGTVTQAEYEEHIDLAVLTFSDLNGTDLTLDGTAPSGKRLEVTFQGVVGPADSSSPVVVTTVLEVTFDDPGEGASFTYQGTMGAPGSDFEMWNVTDDSTYRLEVASGWVLDTSSWSADAKALVKGDGTVVELTGVQMQDGWNSTIGSIESVTVTKQGDGGDDDSPGLGTLAALLALAGAMLILRPGSSRR